MKWYIVMCWGCCVVVFRACLVLVCLIFLGYTSVICFILCILLDMMTHQLWVHFLKTTLFLAHLLKNMIHKPRLFVS